MRSEVATSVFSPQWGAERSLRRSVAALGPYRNALHEVFEYYCFLGQRSALNFNHLTATNFAKMCRDCHLVLDPRGISMNQESALNAMEKSGCWVTPGEVDVVFVRSAKADAHISGLDHGVLSFGTFQLALARLVRIIDARAGTNLRNYKHEFSSFRDTTVADQLYVGRSHGVGSSGDGSDGGAGGDGGDGSESESDSLGGTKLHTSLSVSRVIKTAHKNKRKDLETVSEAEKKKNKSEGKDEEESEKEKKEEEEDTSNLDQEPTSIHELEPSEIDEFLLRRSVAAVDSGGAMTYVHMYDKKKANVLDLGEALALVTSRCILPHARRVTCDGYGKKEAMKMQRMLTDPSVIAIVTEEHQFNERLFMFYADIRDEKLPGYTSKEERFAAVTFDEIMEFAKNFGVAPSLASKTELFMCFRSSRRDPATNPTMLSYPEFVECLARVAFLSFSKPYLSTHHPKPQHKIHGFYGWCRASNGLKMIGAIEWSRGHSRAGLRMTRGLLEGTQHVDPHSLITSHTQSIVHNNEYERIDQTMNIIRKCSREQHGKHLDLSALFQHIDKDGSGSIEREEFVEVLGTFVPKMAEAEYEIDSTHVLVGVEDVAKLFDFFDSDKNGSLEYTEFAYQFYNRQTVSERMRTKLDGKHNHHGHIRGSIAKNTQSLFDLDFVDMMTGDTPLNRSEVALLNSHMRQMVS
jgi:Ca2+-binding EF-hand superfamily protein